jgi:hypothetical protein
VDDEDPDRDAILSRRRRLVALALSGLTTAAPGCYESHERADDGGRPRLMDARVVGRADAAPCLGMLPEDASPGPCLSAPPMDAAPTPCLDVAGDAGPKPCLEAPAPARDAGVDASPEVCLFARHVDNDDSDDEDQA